MNPPTKLFEQLRRVTWIDADPGGNLGFANLSRLAMDAIEEWFVVRLNAEWYQLSTQRGLGTPFVRVEFDLQSPATPLDTLAIEVSVTKVGRTSVSFRVIARTEKEGRPCFEARFACVFVDHNASKSAEIPPDLRLLLDQEAVLAVSLNNP